MLENSVFSTKTRLNIFHSFFKEFGGGGWWNVLVFFNFCQHMLRINLGNMCKVLGHCDRLISWHRGTAHSLAPQGTAVSEWLLVTNMEEFHVPLHGCKQVVNLPPQVS